MAYHCGQSAESNEEFPILSLREKDGNEKNRKKSLAHIAEQGHDAKFLAQDPVDISGPDIAAPFPTHIFPYCPTEKEAKGNSPA